jgi:hypothetical protein
MHLKTAVFDVRIDFTRLVDHMCRDVDPNAALEMAGQGSGQTPSAAAEVKGIVTSEREPEPRAVT